MWSDKTSTQRGYGYRWQKLRAQVLKRDKHLCIPCKKQGKLTLAKEVDHIVEKANGGTDEMSNLQAICTPCHKDKTNNRKERGCDVNGMPSNASHHWHTKH